MEPQQICSELTLWNGALEGVPGREDCLGLSTGPGS